MQEHLEAISGSRANSAFGILAILAIAWLLCPGGRRRFVSWRTVGAGLLVLLAFALLVLRTGVRDRFQWVSRGIDRLLGYSNVGASFVCGSLADPTKPAGFVFAVQIGCTIIFFATLTSLLYYVRILPLVIRVFGRFLSRFLGTSGAESFSTVADIFVGQTEAPLAIKPYIPTLTMSELHACMVAGFATTAGGVLAAYVVFLRDYVPDVAGHFVACSVMCAPASLVIAKLLLPEDGKPETAGREQIAIPSSGSNVLDAITTGAADGGRLAFNVMVMLIAFTALVALLNGILGSFGDLSLEVILGWIFAPLAWLLGVPAEDVLRVGSLLGQKTAINEFIAYQHMSESLKADPAWLTERGRLIAAYALCGFANFASIGIQIGGYASLAPGRREDLSRLAFRAMVGGLLTTCLVAAVAGLLA